MEVLLAISPRDLLVRLDVPSQAKSKETGTTTIASTAPVIPTLTPAVTVSAPATSPPPRVTRAT